MQFEFDWIIIQFNLILQLFDCYCKQCWICILAKILWNYVLINRDLKLEDYSMCQSFSLSFCLCGYLCLSVFFWQLINKLKQTKLYQELQIVINLEKSYIRIQGVTPWWLPLRGNPTDKVLEFVTKTKFHLKIMKFVANFEKLVLGS